MVEKMEKELEDRKEKYRAKLKSIKKENVELKSKYGQLVDRVVAYESINNANIMFNPFLAPKRQKYENVSPLPVDSDQAWASSLRGS